MRIVLSAFACCPNAGSEPGVGWAWATTLARYHDVLVLTHRCHQAAIEQHLITHGRIPRLSFAFYGGQGVPYSHGIKALSIQLYYPYWQSQIAKWAEKEIVWFKPDILHHVTYVRYWTPSSLAEFSFPFIFGPVGGGEDPPIGLRSTLSMKGQVLEYARDGARALSEQHPAMMTTAKSAAVALGATKASVARLRKIGAIDVREFAGCGIHEHELAKLESSRRGGPRHRPRFVAAGRLIHWKATHLAIQAMARCRNLNAELDIFGAGPEKIRLQQLVARLGLQDRVYFHGAVERAVFLDKLCSATALVHPSLHESGGSVCLEAMAARVPVICLNSGGPGVFVTEETGFVIPPADADTVVAQMAEFMKSLATDPDLQARKGEAGHQRIKDVFLWEKRVAWMNRLYEEVLGGTSASKPLMNRRSYENCTVS